MARSAYAEKRLAEIAKEQDGLPQTMLVPVVEQFHVTDENRPLFNAAIGCRVYVVQAGVHVKIGHTANPRMRLVGLRNANPLIEGYHFVSPPCWFAELVELDAHKELARYRVRGEWFSCTPSYAAEVVRALLVRERDHFGVRNR